MIHATGSRLIHGVTLIHVCGWGLRSRAPCSKLDESSGAIEGVDFGPRTLRSGEGPEVWSTYAARVESALVRGADLDRDVAMSSGVYDLPDRCGV